MNLFIFTKKQSIKLNDKIGDEKTVVDYATRWEPA